MGKKKPFRVIETNRVDAAFGNDRLVVGKIRKLEDRLFEAVAPTAFARPRGKEDHGHDPDSRRRE